MEALQKYYDTDFWSIWAPYAQSMAGVPKPAVHDIASRREGLKLVAAMWTKDLRWPASVTRTEHKIKTPKDGAEISVYWYSKKSTTTTTTTTTGGAEEGEKEKKKKKKKETTAAWLQIHGGGMIAGTVEMFELFAAQEVAASGVPQLAVEYRLAPESPHPGPVEDCYAALEWLHAHADELGVDRTRIGVTGASAGGGLAAGVALLARDRALTPPLARQLLVYPMLDDRNTAPHPTLEPTFVWTAADNVTGWSALLGKDVIGSEKVSPYAAPARATDLTGLPPTYIDVGTLDAFLQEDVDYAARLIKAGAQVELHVYPGVPHGFEGMAPTIPVVQRAMANRAAFVANI